MPIFLPYVLSLFILSGSLVPRIAPIYVETSISDAVL